MYPFPIFLFFFTVNPTPPTPSKTSSDQGPSIWVPGLT